MRDSFETHNEEWAQPLPEAPRPDPVSVPMERTVLVDMASGAESGKTHIEEDSSARLERAKSGIAAPPVDVYEPGFRTDLREAIVSFWMKQKAVRENNQRVREKTGIGRYRTWTP